MWGVFKPHGSNQRVAKATPRPTSAGKLARLARMTSPPRPGVPGLAAGLKSNLKLALPFFTASLRVSIREEAEGALRRDETRAALGAGFGAAFGLPNGAGEDAAGAGAELAGGGGTPEEETFGGGGTEEDAAFDGGGATIEDETFGGATEEEAGGAGGTPPVVDAAVITLTDAPRLALLLLVSHSGCHLPFCATGVA